MDSFISMLNFTLCLFLLDYTEDLRDCDHACGDRPPLVRPASTLSLPWTGPLRLAVQPAEPRILLWLPAGRRHRRGMSRGVWLPPLFSSRHVLWWAGPDSHADHPLPREIPVPPKQCYQSCAWLSSTQCNQSGVAHDAPQPADLWRHWQEGKLTCGQREPHMSAQRLKWSCWSG